MPIEERLRLHGGGVYEPLQPVVAGEYVTLTFRFEIGEEEIPTEGQLGIAWRWPFDWADLQTTNPQDDGYMTVSTDSGEEVTIEATYHQRGALNPWNHQIALTVVRGRLGRGDCVFLTCGEKSGGGRGWRAPTFIAKSVGFLMLINPDNSNRWLRLVDAPSFPIVPGPPVRLIAISPEGGVGETLTVIVRAEDQWGNPTHLPDGTPQLNVLQSAGTGADATTEAAISEEVDISDDPAVYRFSVRFDQAGSYRLVAAVPGTDMVAQSNPVRIHPTGSSTRVFWGDLHSGQTEIGCGAGTLRAHYTYARDVAGLQFATQQANDHYITLDDWAHVREETEAFHEPGRFVTFLGCEWSPPTQDGGDRNVIYRHDEPRLKRSGRFFTETNPDPEPDVPTAPVFHEAMKGEAVLLNLHVGGRPTNLDYHAPEIEPLAEIHSTHGTSEWFVEDALRRGYKVGITAGTDGVMTRPGACRPGWRLTRNVSNGLTAVYADTLSRKALWEAFQQRRCYATSGERILLWVDVDGHPMGSEYKTEGNPRINISVEGTMPVERIDLLRGTTVLCRWHIAPTSGRADGNIRILWGGTEARGTARAQRVTWDGTLRVVGGRFLDVRPVGFHSPDDVVQTEGPAAISWRSATAGNHAGLVLKVQEDDEAVCSFSSGPCSFAFRLNQVALAPMRIDAGGVGRHVSVGLAPRENGPRQVELAYRDTEHVRGVLPYWVRVGQTDQARAWSSPVYVTRGS
jgi:hypothetical protein